MAKESSQRENVAVKLGDDRRPHVVSRFPSIRPRAADSPKEEVIEDLQELLSAPSIRNFCIFQIRFRDAMTRQRFADQDRMGTWADNMQLQQMPQ